MRYWLPFSSASAQSNIFSLQTRDLGETKEIVYRVAMYGICPSSKEKRGRVGITKVKDNNVTPLLSDPTLKGAKLLKKSDSEKKRQTTAPIESIMTDLTLTPSSHFPKLPQGVPMLFSSFDYILILLKGCFWMKR